MDHPETFSPQVSFRPQPFADPSLCVDSGFCRRVHKMEFHTFTFGD
jgi:hypothetical protein